MYASPALGQRPYVDPFLKLFFSFLLFTFVFPCPFPADKALICIMLSASKALRKGCVANGMRMDAATVYGLRYFSHGFARGNVLAFDTVE